MKAATSPWAAYCRSCCRQASSRPAAGRLALLVDDPQRHLHGRGPVVGVKDAFLVVRQHLQQVLGQLHCRRMGEAGKDDVVQLADLLGHFAGYVGVAVAVQVHPPGRYGIDIGLSAFVEKQGALPFQDGQGKAGSLHLGVRVPDHLLVAFG